MIKMFIHLITSFTTARRYASARCLLWPGVSVRLQVGLCHVRTGTSGARLYREAYFSAR